MERECIMDMDRDFIVSLFPHTKNKTFDWKQLNYFHICTLLFLFGNKSQFVKDKSELHNHLVGLFSEIKSKNVAQSELMLILLDYVSCPFVDKNEKNTVLRKALSLQPGRVGVIRNKISSYGSWFFDWTGNVSTRDYLYMKEAHSPY